MADAGPVAGTTDRTLARGLIAIATLVVVAVVVVPLVELIAVAVGEGVDATRDAFRQAGSGRAAWNTVWTAAAVTPIAVVGGTAAALVTERTAAPARSALRVAVVLPFLVPSFVTAESWARAYGPSGLVDDLVGIALPGTYGAVGVVVVLTAHAIPLAYLVVAAGLRARAEPDLEHAARASGASGATVLRTVTLPLLRPSIVGASALVFVTGVNAFGVPAVLGLPGGFVTLTTRIYRDLNFSAAPAAFTRVVVLSTLLVAMAFVAVAVADALDAFRVPTTRTGAPTGPVHRTPRRRWPGLGLWLFVTVTQVVPLVALVLTALTRAVGLPPVPGNWTLDNLAEALSLRTTDALRNSLLLAVAAATITVLLGAALAALRRRRAGRVLGSVTVLTFALPGSALAVAVLLSYGRYLRDTLLLILVAYLGKFWAFGHRTIAGSVEATPPDLVRAARASGAGPFAAVRTIVVPLLRPAAIAAWLIVFVTAVHELTMSTLLYGPGTATLAVAVLNAQQLGDVPLTASLAVVLTGLVLIAAVPLLLVRRWDPARP